MTALQNPFTEAVILFTETFTTDYLEKSIYGDSYFIYGGIFSCPPRKIDLRRQAFYVVRLLPP